MSNIEDVRKNNLRQRYLDKVNIISVYGQLNINDPSLAMYVSSEVSERSDYTPLLSSIYNTSAESWEAASAMQGSPSSGFSPGAYGTDMIARDVTKRSGVTASQLNGVLEGKLSGQGETFMTYGYKHGIDPAFLAAISMHETGNGSSNAVKTKNNVGGMMMRNEVTNEYNVLRTYDSIDAGIEAMASNLKRNYIDEGRISVEEIQKKYAPVGVANDPTGLNKNWVDGVKAFMRKMGIDTQPATADGSGGYNTSSSKTAIGYTPTSMGRPMPADYAKITSALAADMNTFNKTGRIPLPSGTYTECFNQNLAMVSKFTIGNAQVYGNLLEGSRKNKFIDSMKPKEGPLLRKDLIYYLEVLHSKVQERMDMPKLNITSGYRNTATNSAAGGSKNSMHLTGIAVDVFTNTYERSVEFANIAYGMGFGCIYIGKGTNYFVHLDLGPSRRYKHPKVSGKYISPTNTGR